MGRRGGRRKVHGAASRAEGGRALRGGDPRREEDPAAQGRPRGRAVAMLRAEQHGDAALASDAQALPRQDGRADAAVSAGCELSRDDDLAGARRFGDAAAGLSRRVDGAGRGVAFDQQVLGVCLLFRT